MYKHSSRSFNNCFANYLKAQYLDLDCPKYEIFSNSQSQLSDGKLINDEQCETDIPACGKLSL